MNEVVDKNFKTLYPKIEEAIKKASFFSIDAEFTGIQSSEVLKYSLFDSLDVRYEKLKRNIQPFVIIQCGIAAFFHVPGENLYNAECFNFYLLPKSVPFKNRQFSWQVAALEFLSAHNFDFAKFANEGISYLDEADERLLKQHMDEDDFMVNFEHLTYDEEDDLKDCTNKVYEWLKSSPDQISYELETASPILQYMMHKELRTTFPNIWTVSGHKCVIVIKASPDMRKVLQEEDSGNLEEELLDSYVGFSKVLKLLISSKKPIIGHNVLLDLMFIHQQFYRPLPSRYSEFKSNIHTLFPQIYDTKFLSFELKKVLDKGVNWKVTSLKTIYEYFSKNKGRYLVFKSPNVNLKDASPDENSYHNAGWDAYFAGYIFIKIAHVFSVKKFGEGLEQRPVTHSELMSSVRDFANCINITRGNEIYSKLDGLDPLSTRPQWLHVKMKSSLLNAKQVVEKFSFFGQVDVMPFARKRVLVAVANHKSALDILNHFKDNQDLQVARYSPIRHAPPSKIILWSGVVLSGGMVAWMIHRIFKKSVQLS